MIEVHGEGGFRMVRTTEMVGAGEIVLDLRESEMRGSPTRTSIQIGPGKHAEHPVGAFINHSCDPSCSVVDGQVVALYNLPSGTEVTFDYARNEGKLASPFTCLECGELMTGDPAPCQRGSDEDFS